MARFFISHSSAHKSFCESLVTALRSLGHDGWLDAFDIHPGDTIPGAIIDGIYNTDYFVLVVTPEVHASKWIPWELNVATYREIQILGRTFVVPGTRVPCAAVRMVAHKNHMDLRGSPEDAAQRLATLTSESSTAPPPLASDAHAIIMEMIPLQAGAFSTRRLEEAFWATAIPGPHSYSFFPASLRGHGLSVGSDHVVVGVEERERTTSTILDRAGCVRISEMNDHSGAQIPVLNGALLVRKIARFVKLANDVAARLGVADLVTLSVRVAGTDRSFMLSYDPSDLTRFALGAFRSQFDLPAGRPLAASLAKVAIVDGDLSKDRIAHLANELQADLLHPLRVRPDPLVGGGEFSICYSPDAVARYTAQALANVWGP